MKTRHGLRVLIIPSIYDPNYGFPFDFNRDLLLSRDNVVMTIPNLKTYFTHGRTFPSAEALREFSQKRIYNNKYYTGIYLYNFLKKKKYHADLLNCYMENDPQTESLLAGGHDVYVISTTFTWFPQIQPVVARLKKINPNCKIILGGRWVYDSYRIFLKNQEYPELFSPEVLNRYFFTHPEGIPEIDLFVIGEHGEHTLCDVLDDIAAGRDFRKHANTAYANGAAGWEFNPRQAEKFDIADMSIDWKALPPQHRSRVMPTMASIGCPHKCKFCDYSSIKLHYKPLDLLREELKNLNACEDVKTVWFVDDNFLFNKKKIIEFCNMWLEQRFRLTWYGLMRLSSIDEETVELLSRTGLKMVLLGIESGSQRILDNMNKRATIEQYRQGFSLLAKYGIRAKILILVGFPGENDESLKETIDFINSLPGGPEMGHELVLSPFFILPLSHLNNPADREKYALQGNLSQWSHSTMNSGQLEAAVKRIFLETHHVFQFYPDNIAIFEHGDQYEKVKLLEIACTREKLAKAYAAGQAPGEIGQLWDELETQVMNPELQHLRLFRNPAEPSAPSNQAHLCPSAPELAAIS